MDNRALHHGAAADLAARVAPPLESSKARLRPGLCHPSVIYYLFTYANGCAILQSPKRAWLPFSHTTFCAVSLQNLNQKYRNPGDPLGVILVNNSITEGETIVFQRHPADALVMLVMRLLTLLITLAWDTPQRSEACDLADQLLDYVTRM